MKEHRISRNYFSRILIFFVLILTLIIQSAILTSPIYQVDDGIAISANEIEDVDSQSQSIINYNLSNTTYGKTTLRFKLFDRFTIKSIKANIVKDEEIYLGGTPIGITMNVGGVIITGKCDVVTNNGLRCPTVNSDITTGDILLKLDNKDIESLEDIKVFLDDLENDRVEATLRRGERVFRTSISPVVDTLTGKRRLGLFVKDEISGVGTLTYVKADDYSFGALGHNVSESIGSNNISVRGNIYDCKVVGVEKGVRGNAGELKGFFTKSNPKGTIEINNNYGIYGKVENSLVEGREKILLASRFSAKPGKAQIFTTVDSGQPKGYDIEIIKLNYQKSKAEKGMVLRVTDTELLEKTGGIVQGMSGSPIVQNGKLIGAVTHVFLNDPTKGYGIYIDWMKDN